MRCKSELVIQFQYRMIKSISFAIYKYFLSTQWIVIVGRLCSWFYVFEIKDDKVEIYKQDIFYTLKIKDDKNGNIRTGYIL